MVITDHNVLSILYAGTTLHALSLLLYMLPDVRTKPDSNKIILYTEVNVVHVPTYMPKNRLYGYVKC